MTRMNKHPWPGNIRELQHAIERAVILSNNSVLQPEDFNFNPVTGKETEQPINLDQFNLDERENSHPESTKEIQWQHYPGGLM